MTIEIVGGEIGVASSVRDWHDVQWQLVDGCTRVTEGCRSCTAEIIEGRSSRAEFAVLRDGPHDARWTGKVTVREDRLNRPKGWTTPRWVFPCSGSDLFHERVPFEFVVRAIDVMAASSQHVFGICTKRAERMAAFFAEFGRVPSNVMIGTTVESNDQLARVEALATIDAVVRWIAVEPMLGPLWDVDCYLGTVIDWVTWGPEIGVNRRLCAIQWVRDLLLKCRTAGVPFFTKHKIDGQTIREKPCL